MPAKPSRRGKGGGGKGKGREHHDDNSAYIHNREHSTSALDRKLGNIEDVVNEVELSGDEDFVALAKSIHALLRNEAVSHDALFKRVWPYSTAAIAAVRDSDLSLFKNSGWGTRKCTCFCY